MIKYNIYEFIYMNFGCVMWPRLISPLHQFVWNEMDNFFFHNDSRGGLDVSRIMPTDVLETYFDNKLKNYE